jgi:AcrR family transcriptional regulator
VSRPARAPSTKTQAAREELRWRRQQAILDLALETVTVEGHQALTMQRIAEQLECGIASVYRLFPSRDSLITELQHQALDILHASWLLGGSHVDDDLAASDADAGTAALTRAIGAIWFWVVAEDRYAPQVELTRRLFVDPSVVVPTEQAVRIVPAASRLLEHVRQRIDGAAAAGALQPGDGTDRAICLLASVTGVVLTARFGRWDTALLDGRHLTRASISDYFTAWGAAPGQLATAFDIIVGVADSGRLAPAVEAPRTTPPPW